MPALVAQQLAQLVLRCETAEEMRQCIATCIATAQASGFDGHLGEIYRLLCDDLAKRLRESADPDECQRVQMAYDAACQMASEAGH